MQPDLISDLAQNALESSGWIGFFFKCVLVLLTLAVLKLLWQGLRYARKGLVGSLRLIGRWLWRSAKWVVILAALLTFCGQPVSDYLQKIEQLYLHPVFASSFDITYPDEPQVVSKYEQQMNRHTDTYEKTVMMNGLQEIADSMSGGRLLPLLQACYFETELNPFRVRDDQIAAGLIQFTPAGLYGITYRGKKVTKPDILAACQTRDIEKIMDCTRQYMLNVWRLKGRRRVDHTIDVYLMLFSPVSVFKDAEHAVYEGCDNPSYYQNDGFDGWLVNPEGKVIRDKSSRDCRITVREIFLAVNRKNSLLIGR